MQITWYSSTGSLQVFRGTNKVDVIPILLPMAKLYVFTEDTFVLFNVSTNPQALQDSFFCCCLAKLEKVPVHQDGKGYIIFPYIYSDHKQ